MEEAENRKRARPPVADSGDGLDDYSFRLDLRWPAQVPQDAPCMATCPAGGSIRNWIGIVAQRNKLGLTTTEAYRRAWEMIVDRNPFPATMGRICPHPCESGCNRVEKDGAVAVNQMERFLGDWAISRKLALPGASPVRRKESIGVIGAGPAGLSFAYQMARRGYPVTVYDRHEHAGGMLRYGIPDYRLPPHVLDSEIARIADLGVSLRLGLRVGVDIKLETLRQEHHVVFVGIGAQLSRRLDIPGEVGEDVWTGTDYLHQVNTGQEVSLGDRVVVVGGGNTAIDAARTARRHGSHVTLLYRRSREEMPAEAHEVEDALEEGVSLELLAAPAEIQRTDGKITSVRVQRMRLGEPDASGRRRPLPIPGDLFDLEATSVITAVSQVVDWSNLNGLDPSDAWMISADGAAMDPLVFSGGDVDGAGIASLAIGQGRAAAEAAQAHLMGLPEPDSASPSSVSRAPKLDLYGLTPRVTPDILPPSERLSSPNLEVGHTISEEQFLAEAERCLSCGSCFGCQYCWTYCNAGAFMEAETQGPGNYFVLDLSVCEGCGKCIELCPCGFLTSGPPPKDSLSATT